MTANTPEFGFPYPQSTDPPRGYEQMEDLALAIENLLNLPDEAVASIGNTVTVTSSPGFATLPSPGPLSLSFTNPSSQYNLLVDLSFSAWVSSSAGNIQVGVAASGGLTWTANGFGGAGPVANSDNLISSVASVGGKSSYPVIIPAGAATVTFTMQALRTTASGTQNCNYPTLRVSPRRFLAP